MEVILAKSAGFCFGVKRAVDKVYQQTEEKNGKIYTYGPIIHNEEVVKDLEKRGVCVIETQEALKDCKDGTVVIRSHGVGKEVYDLLKRENISYVDATCPFVLKIHRLVEKYSNDNYHVVIIGNEEHPEVQGIRGWSSNPEETTVISNLQEAQNFTLKTDKKICVVSQTTFNNKKFKELVEIITEKGYDIIVLNTICNATQERQAEARKIAANVDAMIVIGGKTSSNTQKLFEICKKECEITCFIHTLKVLDLSKLQSINSVGITAGASTPNKIIEEVQKNVRNEF